MSDLYFGPNRRERERSDPDDIWTRRFTAWGSLSVTLAIFILFAYAFIVTSNREDSQAFNGLSETIKAAVMIAIGFWLGNSNSKQKQDDVIANANVKQTENTSAAIAALATSVPSVAQAPQTLTQTIDAGPPATATATATISSETDLEPKKD